MLFCLLVSAINVWSKWRSKMMKKNAFAGALAFTQLSREGETNYTFPNRGNCILLMVVVFLSCRKLVSEAKSEEEEELEEDRRLRSLWVFDIEFVSFMLERRSNEEFFWSTIASKSLLTFRISFFLSSGWSSKSCMACCRTSISWSSPQR